MSVTICSVDRPRNPHQRGGKRPSSQPRAAVHLGSSASGQRCGLAVQIRAVRWSPTEAEGRWAGQDGQQTIKIDYLLKHVWALPVATRPSSDRCRTDAPIDCFSAPMSPFGMVLANPIVSRAAALGGLGSSQAFSQFDIRLQPASECTHRDRPVDGVAGAGKPANERPQRLGCRHLHGLEPSESRSPGTREPGPGPCRFATLARGPSEPIRNR